ncbi:MAG: hypothetical protein K0M48_05940 [Thiobacillus sp.]|nr:hypothetical protein [Thiobacillus sp.]
MTVVNLTSTKSETEAQWYGMTESDLERPGAALLVWLTKSALQRGQKMHEMASCLGVTYGYLVQLKKGIRETARVSDEVVRSAARYLGVPAVAVRLAAGQLALQDFQMPQDRFERRIDDALDFISRDPAFCFLLPPKAAELPLDARMSMVVLYEQATGARLISQPDSLLYAIEQLHDLLEVSLTPRIRKAANDR